MFCLFTRVAAAVFSAALVDDQTSLEELEEARRLFSLSHQHLESHEWGQELHHKKKYFIDCVYL